MRIVMPIVNFVKEKKQIQVPEGANLRTEAMKAGIKLYGGINGYFARLNELVNCHGFGHCGTCRVLITKGMDNTSSRGPLEKFTCNFNPMASSTYIGHEETMRLACRTQVLGDIDVVTKPELNLTGEPFFS